MQRKAFLLAMAASMATLCLSACGNGTSASIRREDPKTQKSEAARIHTELGQKYLQQGKTEIALDKLQKALEFDPNYADAHTVIAVLYESINDMTKAGEHYRRAVELKPKSGAENNNYGQFLCAQGHYDEAQAYFKKALADPFYATPALAMSNAGACLLHAGKRDEAEKMLRDALAHNPNDASALLSLGSVLYDKGEYLNARAFLQRYEAAAAAQPASLLLGRNIELRLQNAKGASEYSRKLLHSFPQSPEARSLNAQN